MRVTQPTAEALADGRVVLRWVTPAGPAFVGVRVLRREGRFPDVGDLGTRFELFDDRLTPRASAASYTDGPLRGEVVYYYALAAYDAGGRAELDFVSATALVPYGTAGYLYRNLPEIYRLYDRAGPRGLPGLAPGDRDAGPLQRFTGIPGETFDLVRSLAAAMRTFHDVGRVDGALLPLLAQWVGVPNDVTLDLDRRRNEIRYAPHYDRTAGTPANLRASVNRFTNWDARIKEFVHNVFLAAHPEQLTVWETRNAGAGAGWQAPVNVNLEPAFEGRVAPLRTADGRTWLFYHALEGNPETPGLGEWHVFGKVEEQGVFLPSFRLTAGSDLHQHPSAVQRPDGVVWLFSSRYRDAGGRPVPGVALEVLSAGRPALPARLVGTATGPFALADGDRFEVTIGTGPAALHRVAVVRAERLNGPLNAATAEAVAAFLNRELPGVGVSVEGGAVVLTTLDAGALAAMNVTASPVATTLGLPAGLVTGSDATAAALTGAAAGPFNLADGDTLVVKIDRDLHRTLTFRSNQFAAIANATAVEVAAAVESQLPGVAIAAGPNLRLRSASPGGGSLVSVLVSDSTAAAKLGFGAAPPAAPAGVDEDKPCACVEGGNVWLFWASRRDGTWKIWYARFDGSAWAAPKALTTGGLPDREPFAAFDPSAGGRLWVFWSRKKANGLWNVFRRTTTKLDFNTLADADWAEAENTPAPADFDNREPAAAVSPAGGVDLYFASNRADGWNTWTRTVTPAAQGAESAVTTGQATRRAAAPLRASDTLTRVFLRSNEPIVYTSAVYPKARTLDARRTGSTTADTRNAARLSLRGNFDDLQRYTHDFRTDTTDRTGLYARDCVGVFLTPDTNDQAFILRQRQLFMNALRRFVPIQVRLAFLIEQVYVDAVYQYDAAGGPVIGERMVDTILPEMIAAAADGFGDRAPLVRFLRTWTAGEATRLPDLAVNPPALGFRLYTPNFSEGA